MSHANTPEPSEHAFYQPGLLLQPVGMESLAQITQNLQQLQQQIVQVHVDMAQRFDHLQRLVEAQATGNGYGGNYVFQPVVVPLMQPPTPAPENNVADVMGRRLVPATEKKRRPGKRERSKSKAVGAQAEQTSHQEVNASQSQPDSQRRAALMLEGSNEEMQASVDDACVQGGMPVIAQEDEEDAASFVIVPNPQNDSSESGTCISREALLACREQVLAVDYKRKHDLPTLQSVPSWRDQMDRNQLGVTRLCSPTSFIEKADWDGLYEFLPMEVTSKIDEVEWHNYKQVICRRHTLTRGHCAYGPACSFAHGSEDLLSERTVANVKSVLRVILSELCGSSPQDADASVQTLLSTIDIEEHGTASELQPTTSQKPPETRPLMISGTRPCAATALRRSSRSCVRARRSAHSRTPMPKTARAELRLSSRGRAETPSVQMGTTEPQIPVQGASSSSGLNAEERNIGLQTQRECEELNKCGD